jgi:hypothetical protein
MLFSSDVLELSGQGEFPAHRSVSLNGTVIEQSETSLV